MAALHRHAQQAGDRLEPDVAERRLERGAQTYWTVRRPADATSRYFKQF